MPNQSFGRNETNLNGEKGGTTLLEKPRILFGPLTLTFEETVFQVNWIGLESFFLEQMVEKAIFGVL